MNLNNSEPENRGIQVKNTGIGECRFCKRRDIRLIKAHVIPRSFFKIVRGKGKFSVGMHVGRSQIKTPYYQAGVADSGILCGECEPKFSKWDDYGFEALGSPPSRLSTIIGEREFPIAIPLDDLDYELSTMFFLAVVWRAAVSGIKLFGGIDLGSYEEKIRKVLWLGRAPEPAEFAITLGTTLDQKYPNVIIRPQKCRRGAVNYYRMFLPNLFFEVKTDKRAAPFPIPLAMLQRRKTNYVFCYPYSKSPYIGMFEGLKQRIRQMRAAGLTTF
jgi:hypothetical protein